MSLELLQHIWFGIFALLATGYAILDGFDLGVGILHFFIPRNDEEKRIFLNSIGPVWDGNEVWLVTAGGALFAGFPELYATLLSSFYIPIMLLLCSLIFRAVAIEFRSKQPHALWRKTWDTLFSLSSLIIALILGVTMGNLISGIPLDENRNFAGSFKDIFDPFSLLVGVMTTALFTMHGAIYVAMKTDGDLHNRVRDKINITIIFFIIMYATTTMATLIYMPHMTTILQERPVFFLLAILNMLAIANIPREISKGNDGRAFICSPLCILLLMSLYAVGNYPILLRAVNAPETLSITLFNGSSSEMTLNILLIITILGFPLVLGYTTCIYWIFRGKVHIDHSSY